MDLPGAARVFACQALWRTAGVRSAGRHLVAALESTDPTVRTLAGMFLVQAGPRSVTLLKDALATSRNRPMMLSMIGDAGDTADPETESLLLRFADSDDAQAAQAARDALRVLRARREKRNR